jgi:hypothetical protein
MKVTTKKYQLQSSKYVGIATKALIRKDWKWAGIPLLILILGFILPGFWWWFSFALAVPLLYLIFWWIQFAGFTQHEAGKMFFYKMSYQIDGKQVLLMVDAKHGMPLEWKNIKNVYKLKDAYLLSLSKAQFIYLPFEIFKSEADLRLTETIMKRKGFL